MLSSLTKVLCKALFFEKLNARCPLTDKLLNIKKIGGNSTFCDAYGFRFTLFPERSGTQAFIRVSEISSYQLVCEIEYLEEARFDIRYISPEFSKYLTSGEG